MTNPSSSPTLPAPRDGQWLAERVEHATRELTDCVECNADKLGGVPVLKGTRVTVAQILAELGEGQSVEAVAEDLDLNVEPIKKLVHGLATYLDRPVSR